MLKKDDASKLSSQNKIVINTTRVENYVSKFKQAIEKAIDTAVKNGSNVAGTSITISYFDKNLTDAIEADVRDFCKQYGYTDVTFSSYTYGTGDPDYEEERIGITIKF